MWQQQADQQEKGGDSESFCGEAANNRKSSSASPIAATHEKQPVQPLESEHDLSNEGGRVNAHFECLQFSAASCLHLGITSCEPCNVWRLV